MPCAICCQATDWSTSRLIDPVDASVLAIVDRFPAILDVSNGLTPITYHLAYDGSQYMAEWGDTGSGALPNRDPRGELALYDLDNGNKLKWRVDATTPNEVSPSIEDSNLFVGDDVWCIGGNNNICTVRDINSGAQLALISARPHPVHSRVHGAYLHTFRSGRIQRLDNSGSAVDQSDNTGSNGFPAESLNFLAKTGTTYDELTNLTDLTVETGYTAAGAGTVTWIGADDSGIYRLRLSLGLNRFEKYKAGVELFSFDLGAGHGFTNGHVFDGLVFLRNAARTNLSCRSAADGSELWSDAWSLDQSRSRVIKSVLYMPTLSNGIRSVDPTDGSVNWTASDNECVTGYIDGTDAIVWLGGDRLVA